jgi:hypothetical protein
MKTVHILALLILFGLAEVQAQSTPADGHYLKWVTDNIKVYQSKDGKPVTPVFHYWNFKYYFYTAETYKDDNSKIEYIKIYIPNKRSDELEEVKEETTAWDKNTTKYLNLDDDGDKWLFLEKSDYDKLAGDHYPKRTYGLILSALTVPFKIHPATGKFSTSVYNSNFNAGIFLGCRLGFLNDVLGVSAGGMFGLSNLSQTSAENTAITDKTSQNMLVGNYGGGLIFDLGRKVQLGAIIGIDYGFNDLGSTYIYQKKSWFALALNFNLVDLSKKDHTQ